MIPLRRPDEFPIMDRTTARWRLMIHAHADTLVTAHGYAPGAALAQARQMDPQLLFALVPIDNRPTEAAIAEEVLRMQQARVDQYPDKYSWDAAPTPPRELPQMPEFVKINTLR